MLIIIQKIFFFVLFNYTYLKLPTYLIFFLVPKRFERIFTYLIEKTPFMLLGSKNLNADDQYQKRILMASHSFEQAKSRLFLLRAKNSIQSTSFNPYIFFLLICHHSALINTIIFLVLDKNIRLPLDSTLFQMSLQYLLKMTKTQRKQSKKSMEKAQTCTICMVRNINCKTVQCQHSFCFRCLSKWSRRKGNCPICRTNVRKVWYKNKVIQPQFLKIFDEIDEEQQSRPHTNPVQYFYYPFFVMNPGDLNTLQMSQNLLQTFNIQYTP